MSNTLPWRTLATPSTPSDFSAPSIALPCGSRMPVFSVTWMRAFMAFGPQSSGFGRRPHRQQGVGGPGILSLAQPRREMRAAQGPGDRGERLQMIGARRFGRDQDEDQ